MKDPINDYLFKVQEREIPRLPDGMRGKEKESSGYTDTRPRDWTEGEIAFIKKMKADGYSLKDIATATGRTETSVSIKFKRLGKAGGGYNTAHKGEKYEANKAFHRHGDFKDILDAYCGTESFWLNEVGGEVVTNDIDKKVQADYHMPAEKLVAKFYAEGRKFDLIDLDPFGSAYDCFDLSIRMARKGIIVTFGEMGHKRWKRLDYVRSHYGIHDLSDFTTQSLIKELQNIGMKHKKILTPVIIKEWPRVSRVYFDITPTKTTEQWEKKQ